MWFAGLFSSKVIDDSREKLKAQQNAPSVDKERADLKRRILAVAKKRAELVKDYDVGRNLLLDVHLFMSV